MQRFPARCRAPAALILASMVAACGSDSAVAPPTRPPSLGTLVSTAAGCQSECTIASNARPLRAASVASDSADARVDLGSFRITGAAGDEIMLRLYDAALSPDWSARSIVVEVDETHSRVSLGDAKVGARVYRFPGPRTVDVHYSITRGAAKSAPPTALRLVQTLTGTARVVRARTPWAVSGGASGLSASVSTLDEARCPVPAPGTHCDVAVTFNPYAVGSPFGEFQSQSGTGASGPIRIEFGTPVSNVALSIADPDFVGNQMVVNTLFGASEVHVFQGDNQPGTYTEYQIITGEVGVVSLDLNPAPNDYVAYFGLSFTTGDSIVVTCPSTPITHGATITCSASSSNPNLTLQVDQWSFRATNEVQLTTPTQSLTWDGPVVTTGTVTVSGVLSNGARAGNSRAITVDRRNWSTMTAAIVTREMAQPTGQPARPTAVGQLGDIALPVAGASAWIFDDGYQQVPAGGPNAGVFYVTKVPINLELVIRVNRTALALNSDFYNRQLRKASSGRCGQADVLPFIPVVLAHEGINFEPGSHAERYRTMLNRIAGPGTENVMAMSFDALQAAADGVVGPLFQQAADSAGHADDPGQRPTYCTFRYF